ncbi:MAG TPA: class I SAM-dependent methyltransferase [Acidimicrobiales bacterium]
MTAVDYDDRLHAHYVQGSRLPPGVMSAWLAAFGQWFPNPRPLQLADVGSGTGRFTSLLADAFGGPVLGIEPSRRMRAPALSKPAHPNVCFVGGTCEAIPLADHVVDGALLFGVWHHVRDRAAGAVELARVVRPGGTLLVRTSASDRVARPWWDDWFPEVYETDRTLLPSLAETMDTITTAGWELVAVDEVVLPAVLTRREDFARLRYRSLSTLEYLDDRVVTEGIERIASALALHPEADRPAPVAPQDLLVFSCP